MCFYVYPPLAKNFVAFKLFPPEYFMLSINRSSDFIIKYRNGVLRVFIQKTWWLFYIFSLP